MYLSILSEMVNPILKAEIGNQIGIEIIIYKNITAILRMFFNLFIFCKYKTNF